MPSDDERQHADVDRVRLQALTLDLVLHELMMLMIGRGLVRFEDLTLLRQQAMERVGVFQQGGSHIRDVEGARLQVSLDRFFQPLLAAGRPGA